MNPLMLDKIALDEWDKEILATFDSHAQALMDKDDTPATRIRQAGQTLLALTPSEVVEVYTQIMHDFLKKYANTKGQNYRPLFCVMGIDFNILYNRAVAPALLKEIMAVYQSMYHPAKRLIVGNPANDEKITSLAQSKLFVIETVYWVLKRLVAEEWQACNNQFVKKLEKEKGINSTAIERLLNMVEFTPIIEGVDESDQNRVVKTAVLSLFGYEDDVLKQACHHKTLSYESLLKDKNFARLLMVQAQRSKASFELF